MTVIINTIKKKAAESGDPDAPTVVKAAIILSGMGSGNLLAEKVQRVINGLPDSPSQFWKLAATIAVNPGDPLTDVIVGALDAFVLSGPRGMGWEQRLAVVELLKNNP